MAKHPAVYRPRYLEDSRAQASERNRETARRYDAERGTAAQRGYDGWWQAYSKAYLAEHPLCVRCAAKGAVVAAQCVDHIEPCDKRDPAFRDPANHQALCHRCNDIKGAGEDREAIYAPKALRPSRPALTIVSGPPGAGKSTWVAGKAGAPDVVIDVDAIIAEQTGSEARQWSRPVMRRALLERNARLRRLADSAAPAAWLIVTAADDASRRTWAANFGARAVVICYAAAEVCKARIAADPLRCDVADEQCLAVDRWMRKFTLAPGEQVVRTDR